MKNFSTMNDMDGVLIDVAVAADKAVYMAYQLYDELSVDKTDEVKLHYYDQLQIMADIASDYACRIKEDLKKVRELFDLLWEEARNADGELIKQG